MEDLAYSEGKTGAFCGSQDEIMGSERGNKPDILKSESKELNSFTSLAAGSGARIRCVTNRVGKTEREFK